ncbi:MAG: DEAD/DEAH box helicase [Bdellovibrionaceae bacterium]|nr:DEAD/DEAH box helicase [Pseudobdellovibrionaceae bacterium]
MANDLPKLQSISLLLDEPSPLKGPSLASILPITPLPYRPLGVLKNQEVNSSHLLFMPEVFHRRLIGHSKDEFLVINQMYRMVEMVRYNFSNGAQIAAKEILRHALHRYVPDDFLPQPKHISQELSPSFTTMWPLNQNDGGASLGAVEDIMQSLLSRIALAHRQKRIDVFLQTHSQSTKSLKIQSLEFDPGVELDWRVDFNERKNFKSEFKLVSPRNLKFFFYDSYALEPCNGVIVIHPWKSEFSHLQQQLSNITADTFLELSNEMPSFQLNNEYHTKTIMPILRRRKLPVKIEGTSHFLSPGQSITELHLTDDGQFTIQHEARVPGEKNITRGGWSQRSVYYLTALSQGLPFTLNSTAREIASLDEFKRDWDLAILKHLGIFQYIFLETLSVCISGTLLDGQNVTKNLIWKSLEEKIKILLLSGLNSSIPETATLADLCSPAVLACFEKFIEQVYIDSSRTETYYSETGEVTMDGIVHREFRLLFEMLKRLGIVSEGSAFQKIRLPFLNRVTAGILDSERAIAQAAYHFPDSTLQGILEALPELIPHGFKVFLRDHPLHELAENDLKMDFQLQSRIDQSKILWFELSPKFFLMGQEVGPESILRLGTGGIIEYENKYYLVPQKQMPSLQLLENFWKKLQQSKEETTRRKNRETHYQLPRNQTLYLLALRKAGIPFRGDHYWQQLCQFYDQLGQAPAPFQLPQTMNVKLKPYQEVGIQWLTDLYHLRLGALLADDMGLGKTLQTLTFLESLRTQNKMGSVLVVVPSSLVYNWCSEIEKFTPQMLVTVFRGEHKNRIAEMVEKDNSTVVIITYGLLLEHAEALSAIKWNIVVFDEAQNIKNINSKRATAARAISARFKIALSGTPVENHYGDLYSIVDTLVPGSLGKLDQFRRQFVNSPMVDYELVRNLKLTVKPLLLRRAKKEILDQLPTKQETTIRINFEEQQKDIYRDVALSYNRRVHETMAYQGTAEVQLQMFTALLRLRQVCSDPAALPNVIYERTPPKLETLVTSLKEIVESGESALVFTQFLPTLQRSYNLLKSEGITTFKLSGELTSPQRRQVLTDFDKSPHGAVLLMTLKTGGVGLNLTKASYVFHIEPWWNPAVENQATDRTHRLGQTKPVHVFKYIMHESLEEKMEVLKERKNNRFQMLFTNDEIAEPPKDRPQFLSKEDFDILIQL